MGDTQTTGAAIAVIGAFCAWGFAAGVCIFGLMLFIEATAWKVKGK